MLLTILSVAGLILIFLFSFLLYRYFFAAGRYNVGYDEQLNVAMNSVEVGEVSANRDYMPPAIVEDYAVERTNRNKNVSDLRPSENLSHKRTRSRSDVWRKEKEDAKKSLLKIEQDEINFKAQSESLDAQNSQDDEELINLRFKELQKQSMSMVNTPSKDASSLHEDGITASNNDFNIADLSNVDTPAQQQMGSTTVNPSTGGSNTSTDTPTTRLNKLMNTKDPIDTPSSKLNKLMESDTAKDIDSLTPTAKLSFLHEGDGNSETGSNDSQHGKKKKKKKKRKNR